MKRVYQWLTVVGLVVAPVAGSAADLKMIPSHIQREVTTINPFGPAFMATFAMATTTSVVVVPGPTAMSMTVSCPSSDTCTVPTSLSQFINVMGWKGFSVTVECTDNNKKLAGAGTVDCYTWDPNSYNSASFQQDLSLSVTKSGVQRVTLQGQWLPSARGYLSCIPNGVTSSATGCTIKLYIDGWK